MRELRGGESNIPNMLSIFDLLQCLDTNTKGHTLKEQCRGFSWLVKMPGKVFLGFVFSVGLAASAQGWPQLQSDDPRTLRATGDNMTLAFVPLISLIANFLPRFFNRLGTPSPTMVQQARFLKQSDRHESNFCTKSHEEGLMWPDPDDNAHYYLCSKKQHCPTVYEPCFELRHLKCTLPSVFNFQEQKCLPKTEKQLSWSPYT